MIDYRRIRTDLMALGLLALTLFLGLSLASYDPADPPGESVYPVRSEALNLCGPLGAQVAHRLQLAFGLGSFFLLLALLIVDGYLFSRREIPDFAARVFGFMLALAGVCILLQILSPGLGRGLIIGSGGYLGAWGQVLLTERFSAAGVLILSGTMVVAGVILGTELAVLQFLVRLVQTPWRMTQSLLGAVHNTRNGIRDFLSRMRQGLRERRTAAPKTRILDEDERTADEDVLDEDELDDASASAEALAAAASAAKREIRVNPPVTSRSSRDQIIARLEASSWEDEAAEHELPELELLADAEDFPYELLAKKARIAAETLERTFQEFGLNVRVVEIDTGPVITQFELELEAGLRLSKVTALADDLAIALRVPAVRVVAPIPGKNTVGVEVPNEKQVMVRLRELIEACPETLAKKRIPLFLGKDVSGRPLVVDMTKMPHLLIAGRTGTGKSVCLNTLILSILMTRKPDDVKMLMVDPKMVELSPYRRVPHLMHPVITDMKKAEAVLAWAVDKMEERYDLLARCGVRHLDGYNSLGKAEVLDRLGLDPDDDEAESVPEKMPYIVIVADEMADMMMTSGKDVEGHIIRLAQKSRAVGIHLVLATQKPTVDVITGLIKSNLPARISFQVASRTDSRVVLDEMGAERLLGNGDMLYLAPGTSHLTRAQGTYVSDDEINAVIDFFSDYEPEYSSELAQLSSSSSSAGAGPDKNRLQDDMYEAAIEVVIREGRGSVSLLQRALGIGYGRAARLVDYMAEDGIVGEYNGSQARDVLYTMEQWEAIRDGADAVACG